MAPRGVVQISKNKTELLFHSSGSKPNYDKPQIRYFPQTTAVASVINAIPDSSATVSLSNGTSLGEAPFGEVSAAASFEPGSYVASYDLTVGDESGTVQTDTNTFYGGVYYNLILLPGSMFSPPEMLVVPTELSQGLASAPGMGSMTIASGAAPAVEEPAEVPAVEATAEAPSEVVDQPVATPAPVQQSADVVTGRATDRSARRLECQSHRIEAAHQVVRKLVLGDALLAWHE